MKTDWIPDRLAYMLQKRSVRLLIINNAVIALFFILINVSSARNFTQGIHQALYTLLQVQCIGFAIAYISAAVPYERLRPKALGWITAVGVAVIAGWTGYAIGLGVNHVIFRTPLAQGHNTMDRVLNSLMFVLFGFLSHAFFYMRERLKENARELAEKEMEKQQLRQLKLEAELEGLRAKVNPHFLFNTLNSIASLIPSQPEAAEDMVQKLSHLFRYSLDAHQQSKIRLSDEMDVIRKYLDIEKIRLGDRLRYEIRVDKSLRKAAIPPLLLQPLVENSIKHGISPLTGGGNVRIDAGKRKDLCRIVIQDDGAGYNGKQAGSGYGLVNVRERLQKYYPEKHVFEITGSPGTRVTVVIPFEILE